MKNVINLPRPATSTPSHAEIDEILEIVAATLEYKLRRVRKILATPPEERERFGPSSQSRINEIFGDLLDEMSIAFEITSEDNKSGD